MNNAGDAVANSPVAWSFRPYGLDSTCEIAADNTAWRADDIDMFIVGGLAYIVKCKRR